MQHYDILIATPGLRLESAYVDSLVKTLSECDKRGISYKWLNQYSSLVHNAREATITGDQNLNPMDKGPLHDSVTYNKIIWIDSDISWTVDQFFKLYESDKDIVSGAYILANGKSTPIAGEKGELKKSDIQKMRGVVEVKSTGFGFIAMKSGVFENIERPWFGLIQQQVIVPNGKMIYVSMGEDVSWCIKAQKAGYKIYFDTSILVNHTKTTPITWN